jgi:uncharacterized membrane protein
LILLLLACALLPDSDSGPGECDRDPPLTYDNFGEGFLNKHCVGCHSSLLPAGMREDAPVGVDLDTYQGVLTWADRIEARATGETPDMPPGGGPDTEEIALLTEWLHCEVASDRASLR